MTKHRKITVLLVAAAAAATPTAAFAQSPTDSVYAPDSGVADVVSSGTPAPAPESGTLPESSSGAPDTEAAPSTETTTAPTASTPAPVATPAQTTQQASTGNLPFTGFEAGFVALAGLALLGGGFAMRRFTRDAS